MNQYIIVSWNMPEDAAIMTDTDGNNMIFTGKTEAHGYAGENCAWNYKIIELI